MISLISTLHSPLGLREVFVARVSFFALENSTNREKDMAKMEGLFIYSSNDPFKRQGRYNEA